MTYKLINYKHILRLGGAVAGFSLAVHSTLFCMYLCVHKNLQSSNAEAFKGDARDNEYVKGYSPPR